jgi:hypothetical protein
VQTVRDRLEYVRKQTGCTKPSAFASWIGAKSPQAVGAWEARDSISAKGALLVHAATGADTKWLLSGVGDPFPNGPLPYPGAEPPELAASVRVNEDTIDGLKAAMTTVLRTLSATTPDVGRALLAALEKAQGQCESEVQREVLAAASRSVERGLQSSAQVGRPASPAESSGKPQQTHR